MCKVSIIDCIHHCVLKSRRAFASKSKVFLNKLLNVKALHFVFFFSLNTKYVKISFIEIKSGVKIVKCLWGTSFLFNQPFLEV